MAAGQLSYSGEIEVEDVLEAMKLNKQAPGRFDSIGWVIYPLPLGLGCFLPLRLAFPEIDAASFVLGSLAAVSATGLLSHYFSRQGFKVLQNYLSQSANVGPGSVALMDDVLLYKVRTRTTALYLTAIKNVSVHSRVVMVWIAGDIGYMVPRSFFASGDEEATFIREMKARIASAAPAIDAAVLNS